MRQQQAAKTKVLVVEDFEDARYVLRAFLESGGYEVLEAANGREAIEAAARERPALILMDLNMPVLDGFAATLRLRGQRDTRDMPVLAVTAYDSPESRAAARAVGCDDYLAKPIDFDRLTVLLERFLAAKDTPWADAGATLAARADATT